MTRKHWTGRVTWPPSKSQRAKIIAMNPWQFAAWMQRRFGVSTVVVLDNTPAERMKLVNTYLRLP